MTLGRKVLQLVSCVAIALCWKGPPDSSVKCTHVHLARFWFTGSSLSQGIYLILSRHVERAQVQLWKAQHFQTMLKSKLNVLTLKKEPLPAVIFHEPEAIELCTTAPLMKTRTHSGCKVTYLGKVPTTGMQFLSGCTEKPVIELWKKHTLAREDIFPANALLEIRPFQVWLHHLDHKGEATVHMDTFQVARIAYCTADHNVSPNIFAWVYREINDDLSYQMDCHAVECESKLEAKKLAHAMMEAFKKTFHSMKSDGRIHRDSSSEEVSQEMESDDG
ncbi:PTB-containing, cubilin and LRP1-interacting protein isoform X1 [Rousettus aegyptiacus]|nr:PTB-containing, cubilin and LRP1-interacting protein isoform X1 [Rousettus aegyptiacus]